ncbi:class I SAM-dependent methyltransferase [Ensifer sp. 4252]|uniref:class I SAM-dependent methyltransferase n=1 Tax=Ensifer sp. 4252 TaxID=3373915 RepID=UPI003D1CEFE8
MGTAEINEYWNYYYLHSKQKKDPSSFATFIADSYPERRYIIDLGCGDGRDSVFFAAQGRSVIGIDASVAAIEVCRSRLAGEDENCRFLVGSITDGSLTNTMLFNDLVVADSIIYSRFFLHAVTEDVEDCLLATASEFLHKGALLCMEFRTTDDEKLVKVEKEHFRRFISPSIVLEKCRRHGMSQVYLEIGNGLAPYNGEDPIVARMILSGNVTDAIDS